MQDNNKKIAIIGGGITGLSAAYYLEKNENLQVGDIMLFEASGKLGGKISTTKEKGFLVEGGPDSFVTTKPWAMDLIRELGIENEVIAPVTTKFYILKDNKLQDIPEGFRNMKPTKIWPFLTSDLFSLSGKLRIMMEPFIKKGSELDKDESLAEFITRRFGREMLTTYAEPLFTGIYSTPAEELSMDAAFPMFRQLERKYGSVTKGLIAPAKGNPAAAAGRSPFMSLKDGMQSLVDKLVASLSKTKIHKHTAVEKISFDAARKKYTIQYGNNNTFEADDVILTTSAPVAAKLIRNLNPGAAKLLDQRTYASSQILTLAYPKSAIAHEMASTGYITASTEENKITACTISSSKWEGRAPEGHVLMRCFFGRQMGKQFTDDELVPIATRELKEIIGLKANKPETYWVNSWVNSLPQYKTGHQEWLKKLKEAQKSQPGLLLTGAAYEGVGIPDCIFQGKKAAETVVSEQ